MQCNSAYRAGPATAALARQRPGTRDGEVGEGLWFNDSRYSQGTASLPLADDDLAGLKR
jgi:hypothetical protein